MAIQGSQTFQLVLWSGLVHFVYMFGMFVDSFASNSSYQASKLYVVLWHTFHLDLDMQNGGFQVFFYEMMWESQVNCPLTLYH